MRNAGLVLLFSALAVANLAGQAPAGGASGATTGGPTSGGSPNTSSPGRPTSIPSTPSTSPSQNQTQNQNQIQRTIFISGKVKMDDGSPIPPNIVIQRVCNGNPRSVAYTDSKGHFSFQWGQTNSFMADASEAGFSGRNSCGGGFGSA